MRALKPVLTLGAIVCLLHSFAIEATSIGRKTPPVAAVTSRRLLNADAEPGAWLTAGRDYQQSYYSPLTDINVGNVRELGFAWSHEIDSAGRLGATPIVVDGAMFTSGNKGAVYAVNAKTGNELWSFTPSIDNDVLRKSCCGDINRGVAVWRGKVYVASLDGYLYALDASTGTVVWKADTITDRSRAYSITGAPYIAKNAVVIGNAGAEFDARGYLTAYDVNSGKQLWRFFTVPGDPTKGFEHPELEMASKTWDPNSLWQVGLGGTAWDAMAYDPELNLLYVGTGNGTPWNRKIRSPSGGDNLFLSSILALNPDTGRLVWYYQTTPGESWDYTATQKLILATLKIDGRLRGVIMQAPKNGFFYVLDRKSGELLSAKPYATVTWASHVDLKTGRPVETTQADYSQAPKLIFPGAWGGHSWQSMAYNSNTGLVYIPAFDIPMVYAPLKESFAYQKEQQNLGATYTVITGAGELPDTPAAAQLPPIAVLAAGQPDPRPRNFLKAWNPIEQRVVWEVETTDDSGSGYVRPGSSAGVMTTAGGLVFQGNARGQLAIRDAATGALLQSIDVGGTISATSMTYKVDGIQYVAIMVDGNSKGQIMAFKLGGGRVPKPAAVNQRSMQTDEPSVASIGAGEQIALGGNLFDRHCAICHVSGRAPDLLKMNQQAHALFLEIVLKGLRTEKGMGNFSAVLSAEEAEAIHAYLISQAWERYRISQGPQQ